jgi:hypothetical protein
MAHDDSIGDDMRDLSGRPILQAEEEFMKPSLRIAELAKSMADDLGLNVKDLEKNTEHNIVGLGILMRAIIKYWDEEWDKIQNA